MTPMRPFIVQQRTLSQKVDLDSELDFLLSQSWDISLSLSCSFFIPGILLLGCEAESFSPSRWLPMTGSPPPYVLEVYRDVFVEQQNETYIEGVAKTTYIRGISFFYIVSISNIATNGLFSKSRRLFGILTLKIGVWAISPHTILCLSSIIVA